MKISLRSKKLQKEYDYFLTYHWDGKNPFNNNDNLICKTKFWKVVKNIFYYDRVLSVHYNLVPLQEEEFFESLSLEAKNEFFEIKNNGLLKKYGINFDFFLVNERRNMSVPFIFHAHIGKRKWWFRFPITLLFG